MRIALVSDLHGQSVTLEYLDKIRKSEEPDVLVVCGDISNSAKQDFAPKFLKILSEYKSAFLVCGNADTGANKTLLESSQFSVHARCKVHEKTSFCGLSYPEEELITDDLSNSIFITHRPPVKKLMREKFKNAPKYHVSGHLHKLSYLINYPSTTHIQVPTLQDGRYGILDLKSGDVLFRSIKGI